MNLTSLNNTFNLTNGIFRSTLFDLTGEIRIPLYALIFLLSVMGNSFVIVTLSQNMRMRTITNIFILNLSVGDLFLAVFCMPFTLIPQLMRNFIFGEFMCVSIRYLQAVSVCVSCFTLVAISLERYFAICEPLQSRKWQTLSHAYRTIGGIWISALVIMIPIAISQEVITLKTEKKACREIWADELEPLQITYSIVLVMILLVFPLIIMAWAYGRISYNLWFNMKLQMQEQAESAETFIGSNGEINTSVRKHTSNGKPNVSLRQTNVRSSNTNRKRVIKMLFVIVFEYFICFSPLYILNTWKVIHYVSIHNQVSETAWSLVLLLMYVSSCIHPITYCFMNKKFRNAFLGVFRCFLSKTKPFGRSCTQMSTMNSSSFPRKLNKTDRDTSQL